MGFSIELDEDTTRSLMAIAARRKVEPQSLGLEFVRERIEEIRGDDPTPEERLANIERVLAEVEEFGRRVKMPSLPDQALTREALYADHD